MIVPANPSDAAELTAIATAAKAHWGYPANWMAEWEDLLQITPELIATLAIHKAVQLGRIAGFYGLKTDEQGLYWLEHLWVLPEFMGNGWGRALFRDAEQAALRSGASSLWIASDPHAEAFYLRMGARTVGTLPAPMEGAPQRTLPLMEKAGV